MEQTIVDVNDLSRSFGRKGALDGVSFRADAGQVYGFVGRGSFYSRPRA